MRRTQKKSVMLPKTALLELTYYCNHTCKFCSCPWENTADSPLFFEKRAELSVREWKKALRILESRGVERVGISGGEPLLKAGLGEVLRYIRTCTKLNEGRKITVITNGAAMNEEFLVLFKETGAHLSFSLPGLSTFECHTGYAENSAANVLRWIRRAKEESISTTLNVTATKKNIHELYEIIANGLIAGADSLLLNRFMVGGRGMAHREELSLSREQTVEMLDIAEEVLETAGRSGSLGIEVPLCILEDEEKYSRLRLGSMCAGARSFFVVDPSGYLRVCNHSPRRVGYIFDKSIITDTNYWGMYSAGELNLPDMCANCELNSRCSCGCREAAAICYGSLTAPDPCVNNLDAGFEEDYAALPQPACRPLHFYWVVDCSSSMQGEKIGTVNEAIQAAIPGMVEAAQGNPNVRIFIRTLRFDTDARWITDGAVPAEEFAWVDLTADGVTSMGKAFELLAAELTMPPMPEHAFPPVLVFLSDGGPNDRYEASLKKLLQLPLGKKSLRIAISIGNDADKDVLAEFTGNPRLVLRANNPEALAKMIKWASSAISQVSSPASISANAATLIDSAAPQDGFILNMNSIPEICDDEDEW